MSFYLFGFVKKISITKKESGDDYGYLVTMMWGFLRGGIRRLVDFVALNDDQDRWRFEMMIDNEFYSVCIMLMELWCQGVRREDRKYRFV